MRYRLLGPIEVFREDRPLPLGGAKQRALLVDLLLHADRVVASEQLLEDLWGSDARESTAHELQVYLSRLRKLLDGPPDGTGDVIVTRPPGYVLRLRGEDTLDIAAFERLCGEGRGLLVTHPGAALQRFDEALGLWRGPALGDLAGEPFAGPSAERLEDMRRGSLEDRLEAKLVLGRHDEVAIEARALIAEHPLRERLWGQLMLALYRSGRQAEALGAFEAARRCLADELGIDPGPALTHLHGRILRHDPDLDLRESVGEVAESGHRPPRLLGDGGVTTGPEAGAEARRRLVTVAFFEVEAPAPVDPESLGRRISWLAEIVRGEVERQGGIVEMGIGGGLYAIFGIPGTHEDDPVRALRAVDRVLRKLGERSSRSRDGPCRAVRVGVDAGEVLVVPGGARTVVGAPVDGAQRLARAGASDEALISGEVLRLARDAVVVEPATPTADEAKGGTATYRVIALAATGQERPHPFRAQMVGRSREMALLRHAFDRAVAERTCHLVSVLGEAGIGKSRLVAEFLSTLGGGARVLRTRCLPYGETSAMWPVTQLLARALETRDRCKELHGFAQLLGDIPVADGTASVLAKVIDGGDGETRPAEVRWAIRLLLEAMAAREPLVVVVDDVQWAGPIVIELVDHIVDLAQEAPILLVCMARTELLDTQPAWGGGKTSATSMLLQPLTDEQSGRLLVELLPEAHADPALAPRLLAVAEGNPLFLEEAVEMSIDGLLSTSGRQGGAGVGEVILPTTIRGLLGARLDRLPKDERHMLEAASIIGRDFATDDAMTLLEDPTLDAGAILSALVRRHLLLPERPDTFGREVFRFKHQSIRDVCYAGLPKRARAAMHERFAAWLGGRGGEMGPEGPDIAAHHLDRASRLADEIELNGAEAVRLRSEAASAILAAGRRAVERSDVASALGLLRRADELLDDDDPRRPAMLLDLAWTLEGVGDIQAMDDAVADAAAIARRQGARALEGCAELTRASTLTFLDPRTGVDRWVRAVERWRPVMEQLRDPIGLAALHIGMAYIAEWHMRYGDLAEEMHAAAECWQAAGERRRELDLLSGWLLVSLWGPFPREVVEARIDEFARRAGAKDPWTRAWVTHARAHLASMDDDVREARRLHEECRAFQEQLGDSFVLTQLEGCAGEIEMAAGNWSEAEPHFRRGLEGYLKDGDLAHASTAAADLAWALARQGREDAVRYVQEAEDMASEHDVMTMMIVRQARALAACREGDVASAERLAREAVAMSDRTETLSARADARSDLAEILAHDGRYDEASDALRQAIRLCEQKGDHCRRRRASTRLASLRVGESGGRDPS